MALVGMRERSHDRINLRELIATVSRRYEVQQGIVVEAAAQQELYDAAVRNGALIDIQNARYSEATVDAAIWTVLTGAQRGAANVTAADILRFAKEICDPEVHLWFC